MFNRLTYGSGPNTRAHLPQPDYVQWSFWHLRLASFIMRCRSHSGHLCYCCWWVQLRPQIVRSNKKDTHVSLTVIRIHWMNTITSRPWTLSGAHNTFCLFRISAPTHQCLPLHSPRGKKNGTSPWQRFVQFCYSCDVCGDTFDPLVNSLMKELSRVHTQPDSHACPNVWY